VRIVPNLMVVVLVCLPMWMSEAFGVEPQRILKQTANLRPEVLDLALEA